MSHFVAFVFHDEETSIEELLAPYNEQDEEYMEFEPAVESTEELMATYKEHKDEYEDIDDFMENYYGYHQNDYGEWGYITNPNAKWDWYVIGGRWSQYLRLKNSNLRVDEAYVRDIDFGIDPEKYKKALRFWEIAVEGAEPTAEEKEKWFFYRSEYYVQEYGTKEKYAEMSASLSPFAVVTADGEWHEAGNMGWFGMSDTTKESRDKLSEYFKKYVEENPNLLLTVVDCHI